jgi:quinolinate synthase
MFETVVIPDSEAETLNSLAPSLDLEAEINRLRKDMNAVILAHYYQEGPLQDIADFIGDSLDLSRKAAATDADVIVFCGVRFMAETAKILSPNKLVLLPDEKAGCSLESSCQPADFKAWRQAHPDHVAITYINCSAEVKALSDIIVTSSNAEKIVRQIPEETPILFAPDRFLGAYIQRQTGRENMVLWPGTCIVHEKFSAREIAKLKARHPEAEIISHPESPEDVVLMSDFVGSTRKLLDHVSSSPASSFIVGTESGILHQMQKAEPDKTFMVAPGLDGTCDCANCPYMKLNSMEKLYLCMKNKAPRIEMSEELRTAAQASLTKMLEMS